MFQKTESEEINILSCDSDLEIVTYYYKNCIYLDFFLFIKQKHYLYI